MQKRGDELKVGDSVSVWWMPDGAVLLGLRPYTGPFTNLGFHSIGKFQSNTKRGWTEMTLGTEPHEVVLNG